MKDSIYIYKKSGFRNAAFYFFYKVVLKIGSFKFIKRIKLGNTSRLEIINDLLVALNCTVKIVAGEECIQKRINDSNTHSVNLRVGSSDLKAFKQVFENQEYKSVVEIYRQLFQDQPKQILDCGGNIGLTSIYFHERYPKCFFTVVEPFKKNVDVMKSNFECCGLNNYKLFEGGVWDKNCGLSFDRTFRDGKEWSIRLLESPNDKFDIKGYSLVDLTRSIEGEIDILKIDIEGAETNLFKNQEYAKELLRKVKCLSIEIHDEFNVRCHIYSILSENNFFYFNAHELTIAINRAYLS